MPDKFESGTLNLPGIAGLEAALSWIRRTGQDVIAERENRIGGQLLDLLKGIPNLRLSGKPTLRDRLPVFAFNVEGYDNALLAERLAAEGIAVRPGLHCSPWAHKTLSTFPGGSLRVSPSYFTRSEDIDAFMAALRRVIRTEGERA
jgi:selenocysteine lyase/cysteine desulfurase